MILDPNQPFIDKAQRLSSWGHWFTFFNILLALVISSSFIATDASPTTPLGFSYLITNWIGHTAFLTFISFVLTIFPVSLVFPYPKHIRGVAAITATCGMVLLSIDAYSYSRLGYHISGASLEQVVTLLTNSWNNHPVRSFLWVFGISSAILLMELLISNFTWKRLENLRERALGARLSVFFLTAFIVSHLIHIWADATLDYDVTKQNNMFVFSYPATAKTLLAKNGLLDEKQHKAQRDNQLSLKQNLDFYPSRQQLQCKVDEINTDLQILITTTPMDIATVGQLFTQGYILFDKHYVPSNTEDAIFNLLYGLPAVYKDSIIAHSQRPQWYEIAQSHQLDVDLDVANSAILAGYGYITEGQPAAIATRKITIKQIETSALNQYLTSLEGNVIVISGKSQQSADANASAIVKTPLLVKWATPIRYKGQVTQNLDINATLIQSWLHCDSDKLAAKEDGDNDIYGKNILRKRPKVLAANYTNGTIISIRKDKITLLDEQGNNRIISATNGYPLNQEPDIPTLNDTIQLLKQYSFREKK